MYTQLKVRTRMLLGYAIPALAYLSLAGLTYGTINQAFRTFQEIERVQTIIVQSNDLSMGAEQMVRSFRGYLISENDQFLKDYQAGLEISNEAANTLEPLIKLPEQQNRLNQMRTLIKDYYEGSNQIISLVQQNKRAAAVDLFKGGKITQFVMEFEEIRRTFQETEQTILAQEMLQTRGSLNFLITGVVGGSLLLVLFAIFVAWIISSGIAKTINQALGMIAVSSNQIAATIEEQERMATQQATSVNQTTTTMDELGASSRATTEQIETAVSQAKQALSLAGGGTKAVEQTLEAMAPLKGKVGAMQGQILQLSEQTDQIGNISILVSDLANQTNMLALNAAVEAVRAGEHGRGFAVVAAEIRKLADQSKRSAEKINLLVGDIQTAINSTVMVTDEGTKTVEAGVHIAEETSEAFAGVADSINHIVVSSQQISLNAKQQAIAIEQVVSAMNALNQAAAQTASGISQTKVGTQKLNEAALDLKTVI